MDLSLAGWSLDLSTASFLAGVTLLEGIGRTPTDALTLRRVGLGPWRVVGRATGSRFRLVSWGSPFVMHVTSPPAAATTRDSSGRARPVVPSAWIRILRVLGAAQWLFVVLGIPLATQHWGLRGLIYAVGGSVLGAGTLAFLVGIPLYRTELGGRRIRDAALRLLSPFSAPRAAEVLLEEILAELPAVAAAQRLLSEEAFRAWIRPRAYDLICGRAEDETLAAAMPVAWLEQIVHRRPQTTEPGLPFCPRCGQSYVASVTRCAECGCNLQLGSDSNRYPHLNGEPPPLLRDISMRGGLRPKPPDGTRESAAGTSNE